MIKPDVIVCWPRNCDYPLWRQMIHDNRERFNLVIVVFTETNQGDDYREFVKKAMTKDWVLFADAPIIPNRDWRDVAVKHALIQSYNAEWVFFTEQDFMPLDGFWEMVKEYETTGVKAIGVKQGDRLHPCGLFLHRKVLTNARLDFSAKPPEYDHFGAIQKHLEENKLPIGIVPQDKWQHLNGLSHNIRLVTDGGMPNYQPEEFNNYLFKCLGVTVPLDIRFTTWVNQYFDRAGVMR